MQKEQKENNFAPSPDLRYLFFDLNSYFASVEQHADPDLRGKPVAVVPMMTDSTCAIAASYEAKAYGIETGTKIYDAKRLCPDLQCVIARHHLYVEYHHQILAEVEKHIHVHKTHSIDEASCALLGNERTTENAVRIARAIKNGLAQNIGPAIKCSIGIAPNIFLAKIASDFQKPDGLTIFTPGQYHQQLFSLNLTDLTGINKRMAWRLYKAGITSIEDFWNLSPKHARQIWRSVEGERFWYKLRGYHIPDKPTQKSVIGHSRVLDPACRMPDDAFAITQNLTIKAASRLRSSELYAKRFSLSARSINKQKWGRETTFSPTQDNFVFLGALKDLWEQMTQETKQQKLLKISISLYDFQKPGEVTLDLFNAPTERTKSNEQLSHLIDKINRRHGASSINIGSCPKTTAGYVGTKIAFTRVPGLKEFSENTKHSTATTKQQRLLKIKDEDQNL